MVFGDPIAGVAGAIGFLRERNRRGDGIAGGLVGAHRDKLKDRKFQGSHLGVNAGWALVNRGVAPDQACDPAGNLLIACTLRGAPHVYRRDDIDEVAAAVAPLSDADAAKRIFDAAKPLREAGIGMIDALDAVAEQMRSIVTEPTVKGDPSERFDVIRAYLHFFGPANPKMVAAYIDAPVKDVKEHWPAGTVDVELDGVTLSALENDVDDLQSETGAGDQRLEVAAHGRREPTGRTPRQLARRRIHRLRSRGRLTREGRNQDPLIATRLVPRRLNRRKYGSPWPGFRLRRKTAGCPW